MFGEASRRGDVDSHFQELDRRRQKNSAAAQGL